MITGLFIGIVLGSALLAVLAFWYTKQQNEFQDILDENMEVESIQRTLLLDLPIEKKLRNALFETERAQASIIEEIDKIIELQIDLLEGVGKPNRVHLKDKVAFFIIQNPISGNIIYYYTRDLNEDIEPSILTETQRVLLLYNEHLELMDVKYNLFKKLSESHLENLQKIDGLQKQHEQIQKLKKHKGKIAALEDRTDIEVNALRNESLLEDIERELNYQNQYLEQLSKLTEKFDRPINSKVDQSYKTEINNLISKIDDDDDFK
jgi:hypothetical protein